MLSFPTLNFVINDCHVHSFAFRCAFLGGRKSLKKHLWKSSERSLIMVTYWEMWMYYWKRVKNLKCHFSKQKNCYGIDSGHWNKVPQHFFRTRIHALKIIRPIFTPNRYHLAIFLSSCSGNWGKTGSKGYYQLAVIERTLGILRKGMDPTKGWDSPSSHVQHMGNLSFTSHNLKSMPTIFHFMFVLGAWPSPRVLLRHWAFQIFILVHLIPQLIGHAVNANFSQLKLPNLAWT